MQRGLCTCYRCTWVEIERSQADWNLVHLSRDTSCKGFRCRVAFYHIAMARLADMATWFSTRNFYWIFQHWQFFLGLLSYRFFFFFDSLKNNWMLLILRPFAYKPVQKLKPMRIARWFLRLSLKNKSLIE